FTWVLGFSCGTDTPVCALGSLFAGCPTRRLCVWVLGSSSNPASPLNLRVPILRVSQRRVGSYAPTAHTLFSFPLSLSSNPRPNLPPYSRATPKIVIPTEAARFSLPRRFVARRAFLHLSSRPEQRRLLPLRSGGIEAPIDCHRHLLHTFTLSLLYSF